MVRQPMPIHPTSTQTRDIPSSLNQGIYRRPTSSSSPPPKSSLYNNSSPNPDRMAEIPIRRSIHPIEQLSPKSIQNHINQQAAAAAAAAVASGQQIGKIISEVSVPIKRNAARVCL